MYIELNKLDNKLSDLMIKYSTGSLDDDDIVEALLPIEQGLQSMVQNNMLCDHTRYHAQATLDRVCSMIKECQCDDDSNITFDLCMTGWLVATLIYFIDKAM